MRLQLRIQPVICLISLELVTVREIFVRQTWGIWRANLVSMIDFIASQNGVEQISIVAIRTGALLVNSVLAEESAIADKIQSIHYWNPVFNASIFIGQFLRLKLAANMMRSNGPKVGAKELRQGIAGKRAVRGCWLYSESCPC